MSGLKKYLNKYGFVSPSLSNIPLDSFQYLFQILFNQIESKESLLFLPTLRREQKIIKILEVLSECYESVTLYLIIKRIAVVFMLAKKYIEKRMLEQRLLTFFQERVRIIMEDDVKKIMESKEKKSSSLKKIYQYIRDLSGSKQKIKDSHTKIEVSSQKGVKGGLNETLNKAILPFCAYLLRTLQDHESYSCIIGKKQAIFSSETRWKLINWGLQLGEVTVQLARLNQYLPQDFKTIQVFMVFLCCKDLAPYYDLIKESIERQSIQIVNQIASHEKNRGSLEGGIRVKLMSLKKGIEQLLNIKQKINIIFGKRALLHHRHLFNKPIKYKLFDEVFTSEMEQIASYNEHSMKNCEVKCKIEEKIFQELNINNKWQEIDEHETSDCLNQQKDCKQATVSESFAIIELSIQQHPKQRVNSTLIRKDISYNLTKLRKDKRIQLIE